MTISLTIKLLLIIRSLNGRALMEQSLRQEGDISLNRYALKQKNYKHIKMHVNYNIVF